MKTNELIDLVLTNRFYDPDPRKLARKLKLAIEFLENFPTRKCNLCEIGCGKKIQKILKEIE